MKAEEEEPTGLLMLGMEEVVSEVAEASEAAGGSAVAEASREAEAFKEVVVMPASVAMPASAEAEEVMEGKIRGGVSLPLLPIDFKLLGSNIYLIT